MVPSGSGNGGRLSSPKAYGAVILLLSKSTSQISSGILKFFLYIKKEAGIPITKGVGASSNCSAQLMHVGNKGIAGNMYSNG